MDERFPNILAKTATNAELVIQIYNLGLNEKKRFDLVYDALQTEPSLIQIKNLD